MIEIQMTKTRRIRLEFEISCFGTYLAFGICNLGFPRKARLAAFCAAGFPHSDIPGSKVARHLPEAYRRHAASFIAIRTLGIHHMLLCLTQYINFNYIYGFRYASESLGSVFNLLSFISRPISCLGHGDGRQTDMFTKKRKTAYVRGSP